jgi:CxxC-x17-CxxC domain-containing protein
LFARPREDVEAEISAWSRSNPGAADAPEATDDLSNIKPSGDGRYRVKCSLFDECGNVAEVPFKPEKGKPIYCRDHIQKIKAGEIKPAKTQRPKPNRKLQESRASLADIGIAFSADQAGGKQRRKKQDKPTNPPKLRRVKISDRNEKQPAITDDGGTSLKDILSEALGDETTKKPDTKPTPAPKTKKEAPKKPQPTISLSDLKKKPTEKRATDKVAEEKPTTTFKPKLTRAASDSSMDTLKETLENASKEQQEEFDEQAKILEKMKKEAEEKAEKAHQALEEARKQREKAEKEKEEAAEKLLTEEKKRKNLEEEKEQERQKVAKLEQDAKKREQEPEKKEVTEEKPEPVEIPAPPKQPKTTKEVPEDILKQVLE